MNFDVDWLLTGVQFATGGRKYIIICIYMPYECRDTDDSYVENRGVLHSILDEMDTTRVSVLGDWNADISDSQSVFAAHLNQFCVDSGLICI